MKGFKYFKANAMYCYLPLLVASLWTATVDCQAIFYNPDLPNDDIYKPGDINLGALIRLYYRPKDDTLCSNALARFGVQVAQAIRWKVEKINNDAKILPNISLGYIFMNDCGREGVSIARATKFLPPSQCLKESCGQGNNLGPQSMYEVAGVLGPYSSSLSKAVSPMLSLYKIPHVSWSATSEELSNKARYAYFSRIVQPDNYQSTTIVSILKFYNWTYVSTLYAEEVRSGIRHVHKLAKDEGICIAYSKEIQPDDSDEDYDQIISNLRKYSKARVVVAFTVGYIAERLLQAIRRWNATEFIFIGNDGFQPHYEFDAPPIAGLSALILNERSTMDKEFESFYSEEFNPWRGAHADVNSPWYGEYSPKDVGCEWNQKDMNNSCSQYNKLKYFPKFHLYPGISKVIDIVHTYALALHSLIKDSCPDAFETKEKIRSCISGPLLLAYLRNSSFQGSSGYVSFDSEGDMLGDYTVTHIRFEGNKYTKKEVGIWSRSHGGLHLNTSRIIWGDHFFPNMSREDVQLGNLPGNIEYVETESLEMAGNMFPESVCGKPCNTGEYVVPGEVSCCWECKTCNPYEKIRQSGDGCVKCDDLNWPDQINFNTCEAIIPSYMRFHEPIAVGLICLAVLGMMSVVVLVYVFISFSDRKVIKGSSRELMIPIMAGLLLAYLTVFFLIAKPEDFVCYSNYFGFNFACTLIFGPLFLKTYRLYRIFKAAEKCKKGIRMVDGSSQFFLCILIVIIQVVLTTVAANLQSIGAAKRMPVPTIQHVELLCLLPLQSLLMPLCYNLTLLLLCAVFGFLTRQLPDNFNESWYIFISVTTTSFIWIAFFPTYFVAFYAFHKSALLALALVLNGVVTTLCLFAPKIYAVFYVDERRIKVTNWDVYEESMNDTVSTSFDKNGSIRSVGGRCNSVRETPTLYTKNGPARSVSCNVGNNSIRGNPIREESIKEKTDL